MADNDQIYDMMTDSEKDMGHAMAGGGMHQKADSVKKAALDNDARVDRDRAEMAHEASQLRAHFAAYQEIGTE